MMKRFHTLPVLRRCALCFCATFILTPDLKTPAAAGAPPERWNLFYQATSIGQYHGAFHAPYDGINSLSNRSERDVSLTTTLFFAFRITDGTQFYFNPEIAGGRGFSAVTGMANAPNGELPRVASATPKPYLARLYVSHDFGFGDEKNPLKRTKIRLPVRVL